MKKSVYIPKEGDVLSSINYKSLPDGDFLVTKEGPLKDVFSYAKKNGYRVLDISRIGYNKIEGKIDLIKNDKKAIITSFFIGRCGPDDDNNMVFYQGNDLILLDNLLKESGFNIDGIDTRMHPAKMEPHLTITDRFGNYLGLVEINHESGGPGVEYKATIKKEKEPDNTFLLLNEV